MAKMQGFLTLIGDSFSPEYVTSTLMLQPHWIRSKTELLGNGLEFGHYEWGIKTDTVESYELKPVVEQLVDIIGCRTQLLSEVAKDCCAIWNILFLVISTEDFPVLYLDTGFIRMSAEISAEIGFDVSIHLSEHQSVDDSLINPRNP